MRCASISVGVARYDHPFFMQNENRLKYAAADAEAFHRYTSVAWDGDADCHHVLTDSAANAAGVESAFATLAEAGAFELLLVYLSGHGERDQSRQRGWFCLADAQPGIASLEGKRLQDLLSTCRSECVVLIVDCCYAEAVPMGMSFFLGLAGPNRSMGPVPSARLYITSARFQQRAWEEDELRRSVFSDVLLRGLSTASPVVDASGFVDLEARLIPFLREQVPLQVASRKSGMIQEPLSGGVSAVSIKLPTVAMKSLGRELTVSQTVRRRIVQVSGGLAAVALIGFFVVDALAYHVTTNAIGHLIVRPGLTITYELLPFHTRRNIDTGVTLADIDAAADDFLAALSRSAVRGMNTHLDEDGLRPWLLEIERNLTLSRRATSAALARGDIVKLDGDREPPPLRNAEFLATVHRVPVSELRDRLYELEFDSDVDCAKPSTEQMDYIVLSPSPVVFREYATWLAATVPIDPTAQVSLANSLVGFSAHRGFHAEDSRERLVELRTLGRALGILAKLPASELPSGDASQSRGDLGHTLSFDEGGWCQTFGLLALGLLTADSEVRREVEDVLVGKVVRAYADDPTAPTLDESGELATVALHELALASPLGEASIGTLSDLARTYDLRRPQPGPALEVLSAVAPLQRLPVEMTEALLARMAAPPIEEFDFLPIDCFRLLASGSEFLKPLAVQQLRDWAADQLGVLHTMSGFHSGLGFLSLAGIVEDNTTLEQAQIELLLSYLSPASRFAPEAVTYSGTTIITASGDEAVVALGRVLQSGYDLSPDAVDQLANVAQARHDLGERYELVKGLGKYWYGPVDLADIAAAIVHRISSAEDRALRRALEAEAAGIYLQSAGAPVRQQVEAELLQRWRDETEPPVREALASSIVLAGAVGRNVTPRPFAFETP